MPSGRIEQQIDLKVNGLKDVQEAEKIVDSLAGTKAKATVEVDATKAQRTVKDVLADVDKLDSADAQIDVDADTAAADRKLDEINREIDSLKAERARVEVDADTSEADRKLDEIDRELDKLRTQKAKITVDADTTPATGALGKLQDVSGKVFDFMSTAAGGAMVAGAGAIALFAKNAITEFEDLALKAGEMRDALGLSAEEASRWIEVAGDVGVSADQIQNTFGKLILAIGKAPDKFAAMGLALQHSADGGVDVNATILSVIDHLNQIEDPTKRAAEAQKLLGKSWQDVAELIGEGSDQITQDLRAVSDEKIKTDDDVASARDFRDALDDLGDQIENFSQLVGETLVPGLTSAATAINGVIGPLEKVAPAAKFAFENLVPGIQLFTRLQQLKDAWDGIFGDEEIKAELSPELIASLDAANAAAVATGDAMDETIPKIDAAAQAYVDQGIGIRAANAAAKTYADTIAKTDFGAAALEGGVAGMSKFHEQFFALADIASNNEAAFDNLSKSLEDNGKSFDLNTDKGRNNQKALEELSGTMDTELAAAFADSDGRFETFRSKAETIANTLRDRLINEMGLSAAEADDMIRRLGLMPEDIKTRYELSGTEEAKVKLDLLSGSIDTLPKDVQTKVTQQIIAGDYVGALNTMQDYYNRHPLTSTVELRVSTANLSAAQMAAINAGRGAAAGSDSVPQPGGIAGEAGGEFVRLPNGQWTYVGQATYVPPKSKVISVARTRAILRGRRPGPSGPGLPRFAAGTGMTVPVQINVNTAVIGSRFDIERVVRRATRDGIRLAGTR